MQTPEYTVVGDESLDGVEIRQYASFSVASMDTSGSGARGFQTLAGDIESDTDTRTHAQIHARAQPRVHIRTHVHAYTPAQADTRACAHAHMDPELVPDPVSTQGYIFGKNARDEKMAMTTPVITNKNNGMSFVLPSRFWDDLEAAPRPVSDDVTLAPASASNSTYAVLWFSGFVSPKVITEKEELLRRTIQKSDRWLEDEGTDLLVMQYNDPFTPPWKRRNEVALKVATTAA